MKRLFRPKSRAIWCAFLFLLLNLVVQTDVVAATSAAEAASGPVLRFELHDTLQPESALVFSRTLERANREGYTAVVVNLSTPGGLSSSVDLMVQAMRASGIPVVVWAGSSQTRVSGEGLRLLAAADVSLMNPGAFLTPLWTDRVHGYSPQRRAEGSQQLLARLAADHTRHGRTASNLQEITSGTHWFTAAEAVRDGMVDGTAEKMPDVLRFISTVHLHRPGISTLPDLTKAHVEISHLKLQEMLLLSLMNPDLCVLLLTLGMLLIYLEINTPGAVVPGAAGVLLVLLAVYALHLLPLNTVGILLCLGSGLLLVLEASFPAHGLFASTGVLTLVFGLGTLVDGPIPQLQVEWGTALGASLGFGGVTAALLVLGLEARRAKVKTGSDAMLGWLAVAHTVLAPEGQILVRGELWHARLASSDSFVAAGDRVKVLRADGHLLEVTAVPLGDAS